jgi:hypothetical protein
LTDCLQLQGTAQFSCSPPTQGGGPHSGPPVLFYVRGADFQCSAIDSIVEWMDECEVGGLDTDSGGCRCKGHLSSEDGGLTINQDHAGDATTGPIPRVSRETYIPERCAPPGSEVRLPLSARLPPACYACLILIRASQVGARCREDGEKCTNPLTGVHGTDCSFPEKVCDPGLYCREGDECAAAGAEVRRWPTTSTTPQFPSYHYTTAPSLPSFLHLPSSHRHLKPCALCAGATL